MHLRDLKWEGMQWPERVHKVSQLHTKCRSAYLLRIPVLDFLFYVTADTRSYEYPR